MGKQLEVMSAAVGLALSETTGAYPTCPSASRSAGRFSSTNPSPAKVHGARAAGPAPHAPSSPVSSPSPTSD